MAIGNGRGPSRLRVHAMQGHVRPPQAAAISCSADLVAQSDDQIDGDREDHRSKEVGEQRLA